MKKSGKALFLTFGLLMIAVLCGCGPAAPEATEVHFPDSNLEAVIRETINKPNGSIYDSDLESITAIDATYGGISNLSGLEYCVNLTQLNLFDNQLSDASILSELPNLESLDLSCNPINISTLSGLHSLKELSLRGWPLYSSASFYCPMEISDIEPLLNLTNLTNLDISFNHLSNTSINIYIPKLQSRGVEVNY
jgi:Leucine-rich repeat (LRR) protein